jgi:hypothetical protein
MGIMDWGKSKIEGVKKDVIKSKAKEAINEKFNLEGKHDEGLDQVADKIIEKVGVDNIMKAKKIMDTLKS